MSETITLHALDLSGETTLKLFLRKDDGTLLNTGGDALTEISSSGVFTATLAESRSGLGVLNARVCLGTETADNLVWDGSLPEGSTVLGATVRAELDSAVPGQIADAVWDEAMSGHTTNGTYGARVVRATNSNVEVQITGSQHVAADVHEFQAGVITAGDFASNSITAAALAADAVAEIQNGLSTLTAPEVNAEVVDALSVDTYAELAAPPAATSSLKDKITWLFMYARNKVTQTATQRKLYRDDGTTVAGTSGTSDDGATFTKGEDA